MSKIDSFSPAAQDLAARATRIAMVWGHAKIDSGHVLLAMLQRPDRVITRILDRLGVDTEKLAENVESALPPATNESVDGNDVSRLAMTRQLFAVINQADDERNRFKESRISSAHLLLGVSGARDSQMAKIMADFGVTQDGIRRVMEQEFDGVETGDLEGDGQYPADVAAAIDLIAQYLRRAGLSELTISTAGEVSSHNQNSPE